MASCLVGNKYTWVISDLSHLKSKVISSDQFVIGGYKWHLQGYPKGNSGNKCFCLDLELDDCESLPSGWKSPVEVTFTIVNQINNHLSKETAVAHWFDHKERSKGVTTIPVKELKDKRGGFLMYGRIEITAQVNVYEIVPNLDKSKATQPLSLVDVNGFQVLSSQADLARRIFEKYPQIALRFRTKDQGLKSSYMNILLSVTKTLFKVPQEKHSNECLKEVAIALTYIYNEGFTTDWLEKKLDEEKKKCVKVTDLEKQLNELMNKCRVIETQLHNAKAEIFRPTAPDISFNDVF